ncbi:1448_t:CDS:10 [Diversispora eburnea]|uniref:peptidylprolyl isomerase n=1 Tax=Diversispora eburnea TaxID=1213867 RepID=A0A9N8YQU8_9GLOM|nr:1448_t:CDS:10 [Diversispora eburnea]
MVEGNIHPEAKWKEATLPYVLAEGVTLDEYERRTDKFNVHGLWEWANYKVSVYEIPVKPRETCIGAITSEIVEKCIPVKGTNAGIIKPRSTRTRIDNSGKEADASFRPMKPRIPAPTRNDGDSEPWPNIIVEVAYSESINHVFEKVKSYWLKDFSRAHNAIVVKIESVSEGRMSHMQAWHFCSTDRRTRGGGLQHRTHFEFGTHDERKSVKYSTRHMTHQDLFGLSLQSSIPCSVEAKEPPKTLQIGIKKRIPEGQCSKKTQNGDSIAVHYTGVLFEDGKEFDSSITRGEPFTFTLEKRKLIIPADLAYGKRGKNAALIFDVELISIGKNRIEL